jgi:hypothetical protein
MDDKETKGGNGNNDEKENPTDMRNHGIRVDKYFNCVAERGRFS